MVHKYSNTPESEIYEGIKKNFDIIDGSFGNGNRDDEDVYEAAMSQLGKMYNALRKEFEEYGYFSNHADNINFVFRPLYDLNDKLQKEHDALEANGTRHYFWSQEAPHMQRLAARINDAERATLLRLEVHDAKYELIRSSMVDAIPIPGDPHHSRMNTPPILNAAANGKNFSDVLADIKSNNPNLTSGMSYTLEFPDHTITVGSDGLLNGAPVEVREGVKIYSSEYLRTLGEFEMYNDYEKYNEPGYLNKENDRLYSLLTSKIKNPREYRGFDDMLIDIEKIPEFKDAAGALFLNRKLFGAFQTEFANGNRDFVIEFLKASEAKLDMVVSKNKQLGLSLCESPIDTHNPGIIQANFVGEKGPVRDYFFSCGQAKGQLCKISENLYNFLDKNDGALKTYLAKRIKQLRGNNNKYTEIELTENVVDYDGTESINKAEYAKKYDLRIKGITNLSNLCADFGDTYGDSDDFQPAQLVKMQNYLNNLLRDVKRLYEDGKWINKREWRNIVVKVQKNRLDFKNHDGKWASMQDKTACAYIWSILNASDSNTINRNTNNLGKGMTILDNQTGRFAIDDMVDENRGDLHLADEKKDKKGNKLDYYRHNINKDFNVSVDDNGNISNNAATDKLIKARETDSSLWNEDGSNPKGILNYLKKNNYLPEYADLSNDEVRKACQNIHTGMSTKIELLGKKKRKIDKSALKDKIESEQRYLQTIKNKTESDLNYINGLNVLLNDDDELNKLVESQNASMEKNIRYGDMQEMIGGSFDKYFIDTGGGVKGGAEGVAGAINDSYGAGRLDFSDETCDTMGNVLGQLAIEVAICAVAMAAGTVTAGVGTAGILAIRGSMITGRIARIVGNLRRVRLIARLCERTCSGTRYIVSLGTKLKNSKWFKYVSEITSSGVAEVAPRIPIITDIIEGAGFHVTQQMLHNAIEGKPLTAGLGDARGYVESIVFLGVLKKVGAARQNLSQVGLGKVLSEKAIEKGLAKYIGKGAEITGEIVSLEVTGQAMSLAFDQKFKDITVEEFIHTVGMVLGLRLTKKIGTKIIIKEKNRSTMRYEEPGKGLYEISFDRARKILGEPKLVEQSGPEQKGRPQDERLVEDRSEDQNKKGDEDEYFGGKPHEFDITENQAISNSEMMDKIWEKINDQNITEKLEALRKGISEQYKKATGEDLELTNEQLLSILDAHEQDGILGQLTAPQLKQKVKVLDETINDPKIRRFLLEGGFCGKISERLFGRESKEQYFGYGTKRWIPLTEPGTGIFKFVCAEIVGFDAKTGQYTFERSRIQNGIPRKFRVQLTEREVMGAGRVPYEIGQKLWVPRSNGSLTRAEVIEYIPATGEHGFRRVEPTGYQGEKIRVSGNSLNIRKPKYDGTEEERVQFENGGRVKAEITGYNPKTGIYTVKGDYNSRTFFMEVTEGQLDSRNGGEEVDFLLGKTRWLEDSNGNQYEGKITAYDRVNKRYLVELVDEHGIPRRKTLTVEEFTRERENYLNKIDDDNEYNLEEVVVEAYRELTKDLLNRVKKGMNDRNTKAYYEAFGDPKNIIDIDGQTFYTTDCLVYGNRKYVVGYVEVPGRGTRVRLFYRSNSEGARRSCPGIREDGNYSKGENILGSSYETTTRPGQEMQDKLNTLEELPVNRNPITGVISERNFLEAEMASEMNVVKLYRGEDATIDYLRKMNSDTQAKKFYENLGYEFDINGMKIVEGSLSTYEHDFLGTIQVQLCSVNFQGREFYISFARAVNDPLKQVRIEEVLDPQAKMNSFGLPNISVNAAPLTGKPIDYKVNFVIDDVYGNHIYSPLAKDRPTIGNSGYIDIRDIYQNNPLILRFKYLAGIRN